MGSANWLLYVSVKGTPAEPNILLTKTQYYAQLADPTIRTSAALQLHSQRVLVLTNYGVRELADIS